MTQTTSYVGISRDHSASMRPITHAAIRDYNSIIGSIKAEAQTANIPTIATVVECGTYEYYDNKPVALGALSFAAPAMYSTGVMWKERNAPIDRLSNIGDYLAKGRGTPLFDSIGALIENFEKIDNDNATFLIMAVTDGEENDSRIWSSRSIVAKMDQLSKTDRWTFVFRVPRGTGDSFARRFNVPRGNILEWDLSERGLTEASAVTTAALTQYYRGVQSGQTSTTKFFTNLNDVSVKQVQTALTDISHLVSVWLTSQQEVVRPFCEKMSKAPFIKGAAFYQLTKTEREVQDYKQIIIRDKKSGAVYGGANARALLGLPPVGTVSVTPGDHGQYDIYIQSTSINRVLPPGTQLLYWPTYGIPPVSAPKPAAKPAAKSKPNKPAATPSPGPSALTQAIHTPDWITGYKQGFEEGKAKALTRTPYVGTSQKMLDFDSGYREGYKHGRGKKKRLYK